MSNTCCACELPIEPPDQQPKCAPGVFLHRLCYDILVANLAAEMVAEFGENPSAEGLAELMERVRPIVAEAWRQSK